MARIRTVKPEFPKHRKARRVSRDARLLDIHLWNLADDEGRLQELPRWIIGEIFPDDDDVTPDVLLGWLDQLEQVGLIHRYEVDGDRFIYCHDWEDHQKISHPRPSDLPPPPFMEPSRNLPGSLHEDSGGEGNGREGKGTGKATEVRQIFDHWCSKLEKPPTTKLTKDRAQKVKARLSEGYSVEQVQRAIDGCAASRFHMGDNDQGRRYDDLTLICRSGSKLEEFVGMANGRAKPPATRLPGEAR